MFPCSPLLLLQAAEDLLFRMELIVWMLEHAQGKVFELRGSRRDRRERQRRGHPKIEREREGKTTQEGQKERGR